MGLDITAFLRLKKISAQVDLDSEYEVLYPNDDFPGRADDITRGSYEADNSFTFRAGSYSGYKIWREQLADLAGYTPRDAWSHKAIPPLAFYELVNFSDCEGVIGAVTSKKLAADFAEHQAKADAHPDEWFRQLYATWRKAFELASDDGAVQFH